jgi:glycosyltransferase involved in cell wall biosynthesis
LPFHNALETDAWLGISKETWQPSLPFRLIYTGTIGWSNSTSLREVADTVADLHASGCQVRFDLYTLDHSTKLGRSYQRRGCVFVNPPLPYKNIPAILASADGLILPLNFDVQSVQFARYSMPTKTPEYMVSGTPVLVYAPPGLALTEYAQEHQWGYVVADQGVEPLKRAILHMMSDQSLRERLGRCAQALAVDRHDATRVRDAFRQALSDAVGTP